MSSTQEEQFRDTYYKIWERKPEPKASFDEWNRERIRRNEENEKRRQQQYQEEAEQHQSQKARRSKTTGDNASNEQKAADDEPKMPNWPPSIIAAIGQVFAGVTVESAAKANLCTVAELNQALRSPEARLIEAAAEWDAVDLLAAEFRDTPDILSGAIPVGVTLISAAPKVGKTRFLIQLSVAAVRGTPIFSREVTQTKVLSLALEDGARRYRNSLRALVGTDGPARGDLQQYVI